MHRGIRTSRPGGFSLLEVMIVIVIILAIAGLVTVNLMSTRNRATERTVELQLNSMKDAIRQFNLEFNRFPTDEEGVEVLWNRERLDSEADASKWRAFMETPVPADTWGTAWVYRAEGEAAPEGMFDLLSAGPDKQTGTEDDINVWPKAAISARAAGGESPPIERPDSGRPSGPQDRRPSGG